MGAVLLAAGCGSAEGPASSFAGGVGGPDDDHVRAKALREAALATARVWLPPAVPIPEADLAVNPEGPGHIDEDSDVECRFSMETVSGTTPKFYCDLPSGERVKVKYGETNPELYAEVAASRLLTALGFMSDHMFVVRRVRCAGCPVYPFQSLRCYSRVGLHSACFPGGVDYERIVDFDVAVLERKLPGRVIEAEPDQGWAWFELDRIDPSQGGSTLAEVDAFRLIAVFLAHWDNKSPNQRLICPPGADRPDGSCERPLAIMQDVGATFGPLKIDLQNWRRGRIWKDGATCTLSMEHMPWEGGTFPERRISESGRLMLLGLFDQLAESQLVDLFTASRVITQNQFSFEGRRVDSWIRAFKDKVEQIRAAGPCPS